MNTEFTLELAEKMQKLYVKPGHGSFKFLIQSHFPFLDYLSKDFYDWYYANSHPDEDSRIIAFFEYWVIKNTPLMKALREETK